MKRPFGLWLAVALLAACQGQILGPKDPTGGRGGGTTGGTTGAAPPDAGPPALPFEPIAPAASVAKVKTLLTGLAPTDDEVAAFARDPNAMRELVASWIGLPEYQAKMIQFFSTAFQQNGSSISDFQVAQTPPNIFSGRGLQTNTKMLANHHEMFARTALELIAEGRPFTDTYTTTRFMMTPALAGAFASLDGMQVDDNDKVTDLNRQYFGDAGVKFGFYLETSQGPIPSSETVDPASPNFLKLYTPGLPSETPTACQQEPLPYIDSSGPSNSFFEGTIFGAFLGEPLVMGSLNNAGTGVANLPGPDGGIQCPPPDISSLTYDDYQHWRMVSVRQPLPGERPTPYFDFDTIRTGSELVLTIPRVGFFTTPSFLAEWNTNSSNQFRVTMNQTLIVALNQAFNGTDGTVPLSTGSVDETHASQAACFACHQQLDPMRQFFRHDYSLYFHAQTLATPDNTAPPEFAWAGVAQQGTSIFDLGLLLSQQPRVAMTWVQNLCEWANSAPCLETDPEFLRIVDLFQRSNYAWSTLIVELFSSPLVTYTAPTATTSAAGQSAGIARQAHICALLSNRLGIPDVCGLEPTTVVPTALAPVRNIMSSYPSDAFSRGVVGPVLATDPTLFSRTGVENSCIAIAGPAFAAGGRYASTPADVAIQSFVSDLMGLTADRAVAMTTLLQAHYAEAQQQPGITAAQALQSTFVLACESPYVGGLGQ